MPELLAITPRFADLYKQVRLQALKDSPSAFGSTYAREVLLTDEEWLQRCLNLDGIHKTGLIALDAANPCGLVACFRDTENPSHAEVISMWVAPTHRGTGLSRTLLDEVRYWSQARAVTHLHLTVTAQNHTAKAFYERYGFTLTGRSETYPNDPTPQQFEMALPLLSTGAKVSP